MKSSVPKQSTCDHHACTLPIVRALVLVDLAVSEARGAQEKGRLQAAVLLERVRSQMADALTPMSLETARASSSEIYLQYELGMPIAEKWGFPLESPQPQWPHIAVVNMYTNPAAMQMFAGTPFWSYSPEDLAVLDDPAKMQVHQSLISSVHIPRLPHVSG